MAKRILVVEDEPLLAIELHENLEAAGYEVVGPATTLANARRLLVGDAFDAAVLDVKLGNQTSEPIAIELTKHGIPFVIVSGTAGDRYPHGFNNSLRLPKPVEFDALARLLTRLIARKAT